MDINKIYMGNKKIENNIEYRVFLWDIITLSYMHNKLMGTKKNIFITHYSRYKLVCE